jgi:hypothetical protein
VRPGGHAAADLLSNARSGMRSALSSSLDKAVVFFLVERAVDVIAFIHLLAFKARGAEGDFISTLSIRTMGAIASKKTGCPAR